MFLFILDLLTKRWQKYEATNKGNFKETDDDGIVD